MRQAGKSDIGRYVEGFGFNAYRAIFLATAQLRTADPLTLPVKCATSAIKQGISLVNAQRPRRTGKSLWTAL